MHVPGPDVSLPLEHFKPVSEFKRMIAATVLFRCPYCVCGRLFKGFYSLTDPCKVCGARFERDGGEWTGAACLAFSFGAILGLLLWCLLFINHRDFPHVEYFIGAVITPVTLLLYRPIKGWWIWLLHLCGLVYPDGEQFQTI